jgi:hypothetical protein
MCFYEQVVHACGDYKWGRFKQHCNKEYRTGETCGMKLVMDVVRVGVKCTTCARIDTKLRRRAQEVDRIRRWEAERSNPYSVATAKETVAQLDMEIYQLQAERRVRMSRLN